MPLARGETMKNLKVRVTATDIRKGEPEKQDWCPVALAIGRATGLQPSVYADFVALHFEDGYYNADLPQNVQEFIARFDRGHTVKPFRFTLDLGKML